MNGTTRPPYRNRIQRIGRPNSSSPRPSSSIASQCISFGNVRPRSVPPRTPGSTSTVALPRCRPPVREVVAFRRLQHARAPRLRRPAWPRNRRRPAWACRRARSSPTPAARSRAPRGRSAARAPCATRTVSRRGVLKVSAGASGGSRCARELGEDDLADLLASTPAASSPAALRSRFRAGVRDPPQTPRPPTFVAPSVVRRRTPWRCRRRAAARAGCRRSAR